MIRVLPILFCCVPALALTVDTNIVQQTGGDYSSLNAWEAGEDDTGDLVSRDEIEWAEIRGDWSVDDTAAVAIGGWTTDATRFIVITNSTSKHDGKSYGSKTTAYRLTVADAYPISITEDYVRVYGLQIRITGVTTDKDCVLINSIAAASDIRIGYCILTGTSSVNGAAPNGIHSYDADGVVTVFNCVGHNLTSQDNADAYFIYGQGTFKVYNCTGFANFGDYRAAAGTCSSYNCISQNALTAGNAWTGTWSAGDYNVCSDGDDPPGTNPADQTVNVVFVSESGTLDLHLDATDSSGVKDATTDQSSGLFADDIDYVTRAGSWCIGADEYVAAAAAAVKLAPFIRWLRR